MVFYTLKKQTFKKQRQPQSAFCALRLPLQFFPFTYFQNRLHIFIYFLKTYTDFIVKATFFTATRSAYLPFRDLPMQNTG